MTLEEFDRASWGRCKVVFEGDEVDVVAVSFDQRLLAVDEFDDIDNPKWVRCENIELVIDSKD